MRGLNFRSLNFRMLTWHTNYTKISTIRKFPAIQYHFSFFTHCMSTIRQRNCSVTIALAFAFLWARCGQVRAEEPHLGECVAYLDWSLATQPWHRVGYCESRRSKSCLPDQMTATLCCRTHKLCGGRAGLEYFCWQPRQTLIFPVMGYCSLFNTCWMIRYFLWSIPPFQ